MQVTENTLQMQVRSAISQSPYLLGRRVRLETNGGHVVLRGVVHSYFQKQMAQEAIRRIDGVTKIENALEVQWQ